MSGLDPYQKNADAQAALAAQAVKRARDFDQLEKPFPWEKSIVAFPFEAFNAFTLTNSEKGNSQ